MTLAEKYIHFYNSLNGKAVSIGVLKKFYDRLASIVDKPEVNGYKADLEQIKKRVVQGIFSAGTETKVRVVLSPIVHKEAKPEKKARRTIMISEDVSVSKNLLHGLEKIPYNKIKEYSDGGLGFSKDGQQKIYDMITGMVLKVIKKENDLPWRKPWKIGSILATNFKTKTVYQGANLFMLNLFAPILFGKVGPYWLTFKQVKQLGGRVKAKAEAFPVIYYSVYYVIRKPERRTITKEQFDALSPQQIKDKEAIELWTINYYNVFAQEDIEGIKFPVHATKRKGASPIEAAENIVKAMPQRPEIIHHSTGRAFYSPSDDHIKLPNIDYFHQDQEYYSTLFHELIHATGHESRLDRFESNKDVAPEGKDYAYEELIAELGASYLNAEAGTLYFTLKNSAAYLKSWQSKLEDVMQNDNKFFLKAAAKAAQAANFILDRKEEPKTAVVEVSEKSVDAKPKKIVSRSPIKRKKALAVKASKSKVKKKGPLPQKETTESNKVAAKPSTPSVDGLGFITADKSPVKQNDTFTLPGTIGSILGNLQRYKLEIVIAGETHSGKSEIGKQIADAFISLGDDVAWIDWEQGGLQSTLTQESIDRNLKTENKKKLHVSSEVPKTLQAIKSLTKQFKVIALDSGTKLKQVTNEWIDELREQYPDTVWIILMQQNVKGGTRGGAAAEFDAPVVLKTYRPDESDYKKNYAHVFKNRGNKTGQYYLIADKKIVTEEPKKEEPKKEVQNIEPTITV